MDHLLPALSSWTPFESYETNDVPDSLIGHLAQPDDIRTTLTLSSAPTPILVSSWRFALTNWIWCSLPFLHTIGEFPGKTIIWRAAKYSFCSMASRWTV